MKALYNKVDRRLLKQKLVESTGKKNNFIFLPIRSNHQPEFI